MENKTKICCFDVDKRVIDFLSEDFDVYNGSLGKKIKVNNIERRDKAFLLLNHDIPSNIHEYDILIDDMRKSAIIPYIENDHSRECVTGKRACYFACQYPTNLFDPIPFGCYFLNGMLENKKDRPIIKIIFQAAKYTSEYTIENVADYNDKDSGIHTNYNYLNDFTEAAILGSKIKTINIGNFLKIFDPFINKLSYAQTFQIPTKWNSEQQCQIEDERFIPLLINQNGDIISYLWWSDDDITFMFPQMDDETKVDFLKRFFNEVLYGLFSEYFPTIRANSWINNTNYYLPNYSTILQKKEDNKLKFETIEKQLDEEIFCNQKKYDFLHKILIGTDTELVNAIIDFLKWLGFENPIAKDEINDDGILEEDIQVDLGEKGLLIVEVKGIGGTSKDADCSQINKIKLRRCEERKKFDVYALYIVNNERHIEPLKRSIPPFNSTQIKDAQNEKRGMAYTWQFFNLFFNIENGFITKDEAREKLLMFGLIDFTPDLIDLGEPYRYCQDNKIICIELNNVEVKEGDLLVHQIDGRYYRQRIINLKQNKEKVFKAKNGKTGIELENPIPKIKQAYLMTTTIL